MVYFVVSDVCGGKMAALNVTPDVDGARSLGPDPVLMPIVFFDREDAEKTAARLRKDKFLEAWDWSVKSFVRIDESEVGSTEKDPLMARLVSGGDA